MLAVLDIGKTHSRIALMDEAGRQHALAIRRNTVPPSGGLRHLDATAIEEWLISALREFGSNHAIDAIVPVGHGASAALIDDDKLVAPVLDYEADPPEPIARAYERERDAFELTLSPRLPHGLNLGVQLFWQEQIYPDIWPKTATALLWPQYWSWRLCGEHAAECTSLGCHSDLWYPVAHTYSSLASRRGWSEKLGSLRHASDILGSMSPSIARSAGLKGSCEIHCGIHDSNAALLAMRCFEVLRDAPFTLVSTGTWFVAMQSGTKAVPPLDSTRDMLCNVDIDARPVPSARFMGGREYELILGADIEAVSRREDAIGILERGVMTTPSFVPGCGPFPHSQGRILGELRNAQERAALASLHLALLSDQSLECLSTEGPIVIEGRFANDAVFTAALAALRPDQPVYRSRFESAVVLGAWQLRFNGIVPEQTLMHVEPLRADLTGYRARWLDLIDRDSARQPFS